MVGVLPTKIDLDIFQGDDFYMTVWVSDPDTGDLTDLTGYTARSQIRATTDSPTVLASFVLNISGVGKVDAHLSSTITSTLNPGMAVWDFELTNPTGSGQVMTPCGGNVKIHPEVTR